MSRFASRNTGVAGTAAILVSAALGLSAVAQPMSPPDFSSNELAWAGGIGVDFIPVPGSPSPIRQDPAHPFVPNGTGKQPTYRIADLSNPNLKQWAKDIMKKDNDEVLGGKMAFTPRQSCMPAGVPGFILYGGGALFFDADAQRGRNDFRRRPAGAAHLYMDAPHSGQTQNHPVVRRIGLPLRR